MIEIPLRNGGATLVDDVDAMRLSAFTWYRDHNGYALRRGRDGGRQRVTLMHREILGAPKGVPVDHVNHDPLDNRRANLRLCTPSQNLQNQRATKGGASAYKGVTRRKGRPGWRSTIKAPGRQVALGQYVTEVDAAVAYDHAAIKMFGDFAFPNFNDSPSREAMRLEYYCVVCGGSIPYSGGHPPKRCLAHRPRRSKARAVGMLGDGLSMEGVLDDDGDEA